MQKSYQIPDGMICAVTHKDQTKHAVGIPKQYSKAKSNGGVSRFGDIKLMANIYIYIFMHLRTDFVALIVCIDPSNDQRKK